MSREAEAAAEEPLFSAHWHRVRDVRPRFAGDVAVTRQVHRGRVAWLLVRRSVGAHHLLDDASFALVDALDGERTVGEIWERALVEHGSDAPTQDAWMRLLAELQAAELLTVDRRVPAEALFARRDARRSVERRQRWTNPLFLRFALHDPSGWIGRLRPLARALYSRAALLAWLALLSAAALALLAQGERLVREVTDPALFSPSNALLLLLAYPPLKLVHELAHALAVVRRGAAVREVGVAVMVLMPLPYVDASASAAFPDRRDRMLVGAAGVFVELGFAALGALLWAAGSGTVADLGLVVLLTGGLSTLLVNGNPLMKFDAYHVLADALEIPNLAARARRRTLDVLRARLAGTAAPATGDEDRAERAWLLGYGVASALYRTGLLLFIAWSLSARFAPVGVLLGAFAVATALLVPAWRAARALATDPALATPRARLLGAGLPLGLAAVALAVPLPHATAARGVVWLPDSAVVRAPGACEVDRVGTAPGTDVRAGDALFRCTDPELELVERELVASVDELDARLAGLGREAPAEEARLRPRLEAARAALDDARARRAESVREAATDGRFDVEGTAALAGRAFARGEVAGYVVPPDARTVRVALDEREAGRVEASVLAVELREVAGEVHPSRIVRRAPRPTPTVPSAALGSAGGGRHPADPDGDGRRLLAPVFDLELEWPAGAVAAAVGSRVDVRFVHAPAPLAGRLLDALRRTFGARPA